MTLIIEKNKRLAYDEAQDLVILDEIYPMHPQTGRALYRVQSKVDDLLYALKVYDLKRNDSASIRREMLSMNRLLQRPELFPRFRSYVEKDGAGLLRMDWMDGRSLEQVYQGQPKGKAEVELRMKTFGRLCDTVSLMHRSKVVHRDLKPANILLRDAGAAGGQVILIDFGLSFERRTIEGEGTAGYSAPEQVYCRDFGISPQTDIFALAQIAVWLLTGSTAPLLHDEAFRNWDNAEAGSLCGLSPFISTPSEELLLKALAFSPKNRLRDLQTLKTLCHRVLKTCLQ